MPYGNSNFSKPVRVFKPGKQKNPVTGFQPWNSKPGGGQPNYPEIKHRALMELPGLLARWLPDGHRQGEEWAARNPTRNDKRPGSFKINIRTGVWADFATGDQGGDVISLYAYLNQLSQSDAAWCLATELGVRHD